MNIEVQRSLQKKSSRAKGISTYLSPDGVEDLEFVVESLNEMFRSRDGADHQKVTAAEGLRIALKAFADSLRKEGLAPKADQQPELPLE